MNEDIQADSWQHPQPYDWPDEEHPVGQLYLHLSAIVGGRSVYEVRKNIAYLLETLEARGLEHRALRMRDVLAQLSQA